MIKDLPPGLYRICVATHQKDFLNPCIWPPGPSQVELKDEEAKGSIDINLEKGLRIYVRLDDPEHLLPTMKEPDASAMVYPTMRSKEGHFYPMGNVSSDSNGHLHKIVVPFDKELSLSFQAMNSRIVTQRGLPLEKKNAIPVKAKKKGKATELRYRAGSLYKKPYPRMSCDMDCEFSS